MQHIWIHQFQDLSMMTDFHKSWYFCWVWKRYNLLALLVTAFFILFFKLFVCFLLACFIWSVCYCTLTILKLTYVLTPTRPQYRFWTTFKTYLLQCVLMPSFVVYRYINTFSSPALSPRVQTQTDYWACLRNELVLSHSVLSSNTAPLQHTTA